MMKAPSERLPTTGGVDTIPSEEHTVAAPRLELSVECEAGVATDRKTILDGEFFRIGSHESNDLVVNDPEVSRFHCRIVRGGVAWRLSDTDSRNGTRLHGVRVRDADLTSPECVIDLGTSRVRIRELMPVGQVAVLDRANFGDLYGTSFTMRRLFAILEKVAQSDRTVLIEGESGTGKELVAAEIVRRGTRARKPFVIVDCSAISPQLIEDELFGHVKGAFTGADRDRVGAFESAEGGTVFLDEIGEMPVEMQPKLLRVLESREVRRVGEVRSRKIDVRVIAATNRRLEREVNQGRFREDLFFRLSVVTVRVPPLRERLEDIELLVRVFLESMDAQSSSHLFTREVLQDLTRHEWPGNVRELRNFVDRTVALQVPGSSVRVDAPASAPPSNGPVDLETSFRHGKEQAITEFEERYLTALLAWADGNVSRAARKGGMDRMNLHRLIQRYGLRESRALKE
jgi:DNA-binding NtrC family response regulator